MAPSLEIGPGLGRRALPAFCAALAASVIVALSLGQKPFYYDAGLYWKLGGSFVQDGHFSLLNFESPLRGYAYPLLNRELSMLAGELRWSASTIVRLFNALVVALIGAVLVPKLAEATWPGRRWGLIRRMVLVALVLFFWNGYMSFPLSDFPALCMVLLALVAATRPDTPGWMLTAGIATGLALDIRPEYISLCVIVPALIAWTWFKPTEVRQVTAVRRALCVVLLLGGFAAVSLPQALTTHLHSGSWSFLPGSGENLTYIQLTAGLVLQRYETYVGSGAAPEMNYLDPESEHLLGQQESQQIESIGQYLGLIVGHPLVMGNLFVHHLVNGMDARYDTPYVKHLGSNLWRRIPGFLLVFLALARVLWPAARRCLSPSRWRYPLALSVCCLTTLSSAVETRFMLPLYALVYMLVLAPGWPSLSAVLAEHSRRYRILAIGGLGGLAFTALVWAVTSDASSHLVFG